MKNTILKLMNILDLIVDVFIKITAIYFAINGQIFVACICFGMNALWDISCGFAKYLLTKQNYD